MALPEFSNFLLLFLDRKIGRPTLMMGSRSGLEHNVLKSQAQNRLLRLEMSRPPVDNDRNGHDYK